MKVNLQGLPETLLIPLWCRARETQKPDALLRDPKAVQILEQLECDFTSFQKAWMTPLGIAIRTKLIDGEVRKFLAAHPRATVVNLAAGLDTRMARLDNGNAQWYDLDLPEVIELRRTFFRNLRGTIFWRNPRLISPGWRTSLEERRRFSLSRKVFFST